MSRFVFPYGIRLKEAGVVEVFPAAEILVFGKDKRGMRAIFYIDSGATTSVLPASDAQSLGIELSASKRLVVRGITGDALSGYRQMLKIQIGSRKMMTPFIFVNSDIPRILGREGIFDKFIVIFDEPMRRSGLLEPRSHRRAISRLLD